MNQLLASLLLLACFSSPSLAASASWRIIWGISSATSAEFFDAESVTREGDAVTLWHQSVYSSNALEYANQSKMTRLTINCRNNTYSISYWARHNKNQQIIAHGQPPPSEKYIEPGTLGNSISKVACAKEFPNNNSIKIYDTTGSNNADETAAAWFTTFKN